MTKLYKFFEIGYLVIAIFFVVQAVLKFSYDPKRASLFVLFAVLAVFMYFFKKWYRKNRFEKNGK